MAQKKTRKKAEKIRGFQREYETAPDHVSTFADHINVTTANEIVTVSFYNTVPSHPDASPMRGITTRRATVALTIKHAEKLAEILNTHTRSAAKAEEESV